MSGQPIGEHALLSDCHTAALADRRGSVEWLCLPRFDAPSVFARILDDDAGHFRIGPADDGDVEVTRAYLDDTLVLRTIFATPTGTVELTDALAMGHGTRGHELGTAVPHVLLRRATCTEGEVDLAIEVFPRFEYGLTVPLLREVEGGLAARGGPTTLRVSADVDLEPDQGHASGRRRLSAGESLHVALQYSSSWEDLPDAWAPSDIGAHLEDTIATWQSWSDQHERFEGPWRELVEHSGRVLQGLIHVPTGAMVAAPTTSLPEAIGGPRNWDYRYSWVRDASFALEALWVAACPSEAGAFLDFLTTAASTVHHAEHLQIMFGISGQRDLTERSLDHLSGWRDSRPVRVGNGAWNQRQVDVYGELLDAVHRLRAQIGELEPAEKTFLIAIADRAAAAWREPDQGIWEMRGPPQHHTYSKLMCWVAMDRAVDLADWLGAGHRVDDWSRARAEIRAAIEEQAWSDEAGAFTQVLGATALDAACLTIPLVGFLPGDDPRVGATIDAIVERLTDEHGLVYRYRSDDGLAGEEGSFLLCTFWLAEALAHAGRLDQARKVFARAAGFANDVGLLAEQVDPRTGSLLGNFPQAFSHIGLVNAAWVIRCREAGEDPDAHTGRWSDHVPTA